MKAKILKTVAAALFLLVLIALTVIICFQTKELKEKKREIKNLNETVEKLTKENEELMAGKGAAESQLTEAQDKITSLEAEIEGLKKK